MELLLVIPTHFTKQHIEDVKTFVGVNFPEIELIIEAPLNRSHSVYVECDNQTAQSDVDNLIKTLGYFSALTGTCE